MDGACGWLAGWLAGWPAGWLAGWVGPYDLYWFLLDINYSTKVLQLVQVLQKF